MAREAIALSEFEPEWLGPRIHQRVLVIHDEGDRVAPLKVSKRVVRWLHQARLVTPQGLGHRRVLDDSRVADDSRVLDDSRVADEIVAYLAPC